MAVFETWLAYDLQEPLKPRVLDGAMFTQDNLGNKIGVVLTNGGAAENISGTVSGSVIRSDGTTVSIASGGFEGNRAWVVLPQAAYAVTGQIIIVIKLTNESVITTIGCAVAFVQKSATGAIVDPGTIIPSVQTLINQIETAVASIPADYSSLWTSLAPTYSTSTTYAVGQYVTYNGAVYRCTSAITAAESWNSGHWTSVSLGNDLTNFNTHLSWVKQDVINADLYDLRRDLNYYSADWNEIVFDWDTAQSECTITGTATAVTYNNIFISANSLPANIHAGDILRVKYKSSNVYLIFYDYSGGNLTLLKEIKRDAIVKIPDTCTGLIIRLWIGNGTTVNETVAPEIYKNADPIIESVDTATESESGKTDMHNIIQEMLDIYGYCRLSPGAFYINGTLIIPEHGTLEGCGESTQIYLMSGNNKTAIQLRRYGAVRNLSLIGSYTDLTESDFGTSAGSRYGIQYYKGSSDSWTPAYSSISNVFIKNFTAAGIYQYGTGANVEQGLFVSDVHIKNCWCGIWIYSNSEFCRYSNVQITYCYIACINNGGNNSFSNCVFHAYTVGMKIDGTQNNSAHGMCSNSSFCHSGDDLGSAVTLSDIVHGYVFSACQYWYNSINITNCGGIVFNGCEIGRSTPIYINGGNTVMFGNCAFMNDVLYEPSINVTNNTKVRFTGCYGSVSGNLIEP